MAPQKIRDTNHARTCLAAANASGQTRVEWARAHGIDARSLNAWRLNLERRDAPHDDLRLVELVPNQLATRPFGQHRVRCGEFVVEINDDFDEGVLLRLLRVVAAC